jgi:hypothetical protein
MQHCCVQRSGLKRTSSAQSTRRTILCWAETLATEASRIASASQGMTSPSILRLVVAPLASP